MIVVRVALLQPVVAIVRVVDLFAQFAGGMKRLVAVSKRGVHIGVMCHHAASGGDDPLGALFISRLRLTLQRHLHVITHLHRGHRRVVGFAAVIVKQPLPQSEIAAPFQR